MAVRDISQVDEEDFDEVPDGAEAKKTEEPLPSDEALTLEAEAEAQPTAPAGDGENEIVVVDEDTMTLINTETGEVVGYADLPPEDLGDVDLAKWIGEKRAWHKGKLEGFKAEKQTWIDIINKRYDTQIKRHESAIKWFDTTYYQFLFDLARKLIGAGKKRSVACGLLLLKLRKTSAKVEILDSDKAIKWLEGAGVEEAVKTTKSILVSMLPEELKAKLVKPSNQEKTGLAFNPGGEDQLKIE